MNALRVSAAQVRKLRRSGVKLPMPPSPDLKLPSLPGVAGLDLRNEHEFQAASVSYYRRIMVPTADVIAVPIQRHLGHLPKMKRIFVLRQLDDEGMRTGTLDTLFEWDPRNGEPGNLGACWIEMKRAVKPEPLKAAQLKFILWRRAMGRVAGVAQCYEHIEDLLKEAGAPLRMWQHARRDVPPWWAPLGELPPLYGNFGDYISLPGGGTLDLRLLEAQRGATP